MQKTRIGIYTKPAELMKYNEKERMKSSNQRVEVLEIDGIYAWVRPVGNTTEGSKTLLKYLTFEDGTSK